MPSDAMVQTRVSSNPTMLPTGEYGIASRFTDEPTEAYTLWHIRFYSEEAAQYFINTNYPNSSALQMEWAIVKL